MSDQALEQKNAEQALPSVDIMRTTSDLTSSDKWDHFKARWGVKRNEHRVKPGLYALGAPTPESPVFVSANYTLSFDALRSSLRGLDAYVLVIDTQGINVWCAAGKGHFGTAEVIDKIEKTRLADVVSHRTIILPQLCAPGVAGQRIEKRTGFAVEWGPVRASDLPEYLRTHTATPEMRRVRFDLWDRLVVVPVEIVHMLLYMVIAAIGLTLIGGPLMGGGAVASILAGVVLFPALLPFIPTRDFSSKGFILGALVALPFSLALLSTPYPLWWQIGMAVAFELAFSSVTAFLALNFTGSTPFTSRTAVRIEIFKYIPVMAWAGGIGVGIAVVLTALRFLRVA